MSKGVHFFSVLGGNIRQSYFPIIRWGLDRVDIGLDQREPQRAEPQTALKTCV